MSTKIEEIIIDNVKAIDHKELSLNGFSAYVVGRNGGGKSTLISCLIKCLQGIKPSVILREGTENGRAFIKLTTGQTFDWKIDESKKGNLAEIKFTTADGIKTPVTTDIAQRFFPKGFNIDKFLGSRPKEQQKELEKIAGIDLDDVNKRYETEYANRTNKNREVKTREAALKPVNSTLAIIESPTDEIQKELNLIDSHNESYNRIKKGVADKNIKLPQQAKEIKRLKELLTAAEKEEKQLKKEIADGDAWMAIEKNKPKDDAYHFSLSQKLQGVTDNNKKIVENNEAIKAKEAFDLFKKDADKLDEKVKAIEKEKGNLIKTAKIPANFAFVTDGEGITYKGRPFEAEIMSLSDRYKAALELNLLTLGECKMMHFEGSALDPDGLNEVIKWADENDLQILVELPRAGDVTYQIIDKSVK